MILSSSRKSLTIFPARFHEAYFANRLNDILFMAGEHDAAIISTKRL